MNYVFNNFVKRVVERYGGRVTIVLFGSRARGDYWPSSDYDVMIFLEDVRDEALEATEILQLRESPFPMDVLVKKKDDVANPLVSEMLKHKRVIYDGLGLFAGGGVG